MLLVVVGLLWSRWCRAKCGRNAEFETTMMSVVCMWLSLWILYREGED